MNGVLWVWVLKKAWKIDMKILQKKEFENDARLNRGSVKKFLEVRENGKSEETV